MKNNEHENKLTPEQEKELFSRLEVSYSRSKNDVWEAMQKKMATKESSAEATPAKTVSINTRRKKLTYISAAASVVLVMSLGLFARFYTTTITVAAGEFKSHKLPDGSTIHLNAVSTIAYSPYWWRFNREVDLKGEAFFEVQKGKNFKVVSRLGATEVLGTTFNILARGNSYEVLCTTGKVRVSNQNNSKVILTPGQYARLEAKGLVKEAKAKVKDAMFAWRLQKFSYNTTPMTKVFGDLERHYNVKVNVETESVLKEYYTGNFKRSVTVEQALEIICSSFELSFEKKSDRLYIIKKN